jgi:hypothetical protein
MRVWMVVAALALAGCDDDDSGPLRPCIGEGPVCEGLCPLFDERVATVQRQWDDGDIDGYVTHICGAYRVVTRYADEGRVDNYFDQNGVLAATALRDGPSGQYGNGCLDHVRWQGQPIDCASTCAIDYSRPPETLIGVPPCEDECRLAEPVCEGVCPSLSERRDDVRTQYEFDQIDAWFHSTCGDYQVISRFSGAQNRTDNYFDDDGVLISTRLEGSEQASGCSDFEAWQGPVLDCALSCTVEESRQPTELLGVQPCRCQLPAPECEGLCPTFPDRLRDVKGQFAARQIDGYVTWRCGDYRVVSRYSDRGQSDNYYTNDETLVATALRGNDPDFGQFCRDDVAWQGTPVVCEPECAFESSRNPFTLIGVGYCNAPDMGVSDAGPSDGGTPDAASPDAGTADAGACVAEGGSTPVIPNAPECCPGLAPIGCERPDNEGICPPGCEGATICAQCGNGVCGAGENACNCPADCSGAECVAAGGVVPVVPNAPSCCAGLAPIGCDQPGADGQCPGGCEGASVCARCGDGACGAGENPCNCAQDCPADGMCRTTNDCVDHPAPIRCLGGWRCDPADARASDHQGDDGCNYTCLGALTACSAERPCPEGDRCAPCPVAGACDGPTVCRAGDDDSCGTPADCAGLVHPDCVGGWECVANRCSYRCGD